MLWKSFLLVFVLCFIFSFLFAVILYIRKTRTTKKYSFKAGIYDGKNSDEDRKIKKYLEDSMEHHSSMAFRSVSDPDER